MITFGPVRKGDNSDLDLAEELTISKLEDDSLYGPVPDVPIQDSFGRCLLVSYLLLIVIFYFLLLLLCCYCCYCYEVLI